VSIATAKPKTAVTRSRAGAAGKRLPPVVVTRPARGSPPTNAGNAPAFVQSARIEAEVG
jgi:hypothetical protein